VNGGLLVHTSFLPNPFKPGHGDLMNLLVAFINRAKWAAETVQGRAA
jgi:hypothetical protein